METQEEIIERLLRQIATCRRYTGRIANFHEDINFLFNDQELRSLKISTMNAYLERCEIRIQNGEENKIASDAMIEGNFDIFGKGNALSSRMCVFTLNLSHLSDLEVNLINTKSVNKIAELKKQVLAEIKKSLEIQIAY